MTDPNELLNQVTEINRKKIVINAISNYINYAIAILVGIFLQAFIIRKLGKHEYAIWPLIVTCLGFVSLIPTGVGSGTARFLAHALGRKDINEVVRITSTLFFALLIAACFYMLIILFLSIFFESIFDIPPGAQGIGPPALLLAGLSGAFALPFGVFHGGLQAAQKFLALNIIRIISSITRLILILSLFSAGFQNLIYVAAVNLVLSIGENLFVYGLAHKTIPWQRVRFQSFYWATFKQINNFSLLVLLSAIGGLLYWKTDNIIINKLLDPTLLTGYAVVVNFILYSHQINSLGIRVIAPVATVMHAKGNISQISRLLYRANRTVVPFTLCLLCFLMVFGREILRLYLGTEYMEFASLFFIFGAGVMVSDTQNSAAIVPQAFGRMGVVSIMSFIVALCNVLLSIYFVCVLKWGLIGVAAGTASVIIVYKWGFWPWYTARLLDISWKEYVYKSIVIPMGNSIPFVISIIIMKYLNFGRGWMGLATVFFLAFLIQITYMFFKGLDENDRNHIKSMLHKCHLPF